MLGSDLRDAEAYELPDLASSSNYLDEGHSNVEVEGLLSGKQRGGIDELGESGDGETIGQGSKIDTLIAEHVPATDDPTLPTLTLRVLLIGSFFCLLGASASQIFYFKSNAPSFSSYFIILATYPLGHGLANERFIPRGQRFLGLELNPGPFSIKEAILVSVLASSGATSAYATDILAIMDLYFHVTLGPISSIILLLTTQCIGFGLAGMLQTILVYPPAMYWPSILVVVQLFTTLYSSTSSALSRAAQLATRDRLKVFTFVFLITFIYQYLPFFLFPTLTSISVLCLIDNDSWWMRVLGSGYKGLGMLDFSFDWSTIGSSGPLFTPYWALGNFFGGLIGMCWIVTPLLFLFNFWDARRYPEPVSSGLYNSRFEKFDVASVLNEDLSLNEIAYEQNRPLLLTPYFALSYGLSFAALSSILVHVWLWHRDEIKEALSKRTAALTDVHNRLMRNYLPVPSSWYFGLLAVNFGAAVLLVKTTPLQMPIWALVLSIAIATVFLIPVGIIAAVSNTTIGLNVLTEFVAGVLMPGKPIGNVTFKCFGYMAMSQALALAQDLKLGWYTSIPPREMFACQIIGTVLGVFANYITLISVINEKRSFLDGTAVDPTGQWTGRAPGIFYSASIIWGAVAPKRFFSGGYEVLYLGFLLGAIVPIGCWFAHQRWPHMKFNKVVFPIICHGATLVPQYPTNIILTGAIVAVLANSWYAKKHPGLYSKYAYVVSSALDAGTSITALSIYVLFGVLFRWDGPRWWGNPATDSEHCTPGS
ncbi:OPT oligopeptide transporter protein-domain-containing protein [Kockovaella imperatae]|uniref:OPT oligopeptide transporter protein-domain-containing protein n=1 Tax=Kockovaella imperatae TaxID=4999 RepID=A0A1Y1UMR8_9TREE|nr:OPT oligopeptide transporter protein-domain-containing protein [Kockovaella imperatae]ORX39348.1 OPT oligopeptide transporter protein-domain-containing protein [Kockovaella imperatae]